jgi:hypothetical protein
MTTTPRASTAYSRCKGQRSATRPLAWSALLSVAPATAGLLSVGAAITRFGKTSPEALFLLGIASALCVVAAGTVAIVSAVVSRSPEIRRINALYYLARQTNSPAERLSAMTLMSMEKGMAEPERESVAKLVQMILEVVPHLDAPAANTPQTLGATTAYTKGQCRNHQVNTAQTSPAC